MTHKESWNQNFELLKAGVLDEEKTRIFLKLMDSRSKEHTGGRIKKTKNIDF